ncbi:hypothetical protein BD779DRAFT_1061220 [Infundibulicybe gibba]|nr:hypothetical protein BD779DRAFT_1061220 [Infundibulicybe gibba]
MVLTSMSTLKSETTRPRRNLPLMRIHDLLCHGQRSALICQFSDTHGYGKQFEPPYNEPHPGEIGHFSTIPINATTSSASEKVVYPSQAIAQCTTQYRPLGESRSYPPSEPADWCYYALIIPDLRTRDHPSSKSDVGVRVALSSANLSVSIWYSRPRELPATAAGHEIQGTGHLRSKFKSDYRRTSML